MKSVSYVPYCIASLLLLTGLSPTHGAKLFPYGPELDREFADLGDDDYIVVNLSRPLPFAGNLWDNITVSKTYSFELRFF